MNEILLNGILNLFAIQAAMHPETDEVKPRLFLELYLRRHILLSDPDIYLGFLTERILPYSVITRNTGWLSSGNRAF